MQLAENRAVTPERRQSDTAPAPHMLEERIRQLEQQLVSMTVHANRDPLTGLLNRRGFDTAYRILEGQAIRADTPMACVAIDIDDFKPINDELGHAAGDAALQAFAVRLTASCRRQDLCARFGGDEFILLLPGTGSESALALVERIRNPASLPGCDAAAANYPLSFSAGIAYGATQASQTDWLEIADTALRKAKKAGKARTISIALQRDSGGLAR